MRVGCSVGCRSRCVSCTVPRCARCSGMYIEQPELRCLQGWQGWSEPQRGGSAVPCCCGGSGCARRSPCPVQGIDKSHKRAWGAWAGGRALLLVSRLPLGATLPLGLCWQGCACPRWDRRPCHPRSVTAGVSLMLSPRGEWPGCPASRRRVGGGVTRAFLPGHRGEPVQRQVRPRAPLPDGHLRAGGVSRG